MMESTEEAKVPAEQSTTFQPQLQALQESHILLKPFDMLRKVSGISKMFLFFTRYFCVYACALKFWLFKYPFFILC